MGGLTTPRRSVFIALAWLIFIFGGPAIAAADCLQSSQTAWTNAPFTAQPAQFTASFDAIPSQLDMAGAVGFSWNAVTNYTSLAAIVRFSYAGTIDVLNGGLYESNQTVAYAAAQSYHFRMVIDPAAGVYSVYVTPPGGIEIALAIGFQFHGAPTGTPDLNNWALFSEVGSVLICNMMVTPNAAPAGVPMISLQPSSIGFGTVSVGNSETLPISITSSGSATLTISNVIASGAGFSAGGVSAGLILAPGQTATLNAIFAPSSPGSTTGSVVIASNASNSAAASVSLSGAAQVISHSVMLTWAASLSSVVGYNVYRGTTSGGPYTRENSSPVAPLNYSDTSVLGGQTYFYVVTAVNASDEESVFSNVASATVPEL